MSGVVHALLIGISDYPNLRDGVADELTFGLRPLESAALTVAEIAAWLGENELAQRELGSCTVLAAPSTVESTDVRFAGLALGCTHDQFVREVAEWRRRASQDPDDFALFYFAGHGTQRQQRDHVLLLQDIGDGYGAALSKAFDSTTLIDGMAVTDDFPDMARRQLYVFDACRASLEDITAYVKPEPIKFWDWKDPSNEQRQLRTAPVLYTAVDGSDAYGISGQQSVFSAALLACLDGSAAIEEDDDDSGGVRWTVSLTSLIRGLERELKGLHEHGIEQRPESAGISEDLILYVFDHAPDAAIEVTLEPEDVAGDARLEVLDDDDAQVRFVDRVGANPYLDIVPAGYYTFLATCTRDGRKGKRQRRVAPPRRRFEIRLQEP